MERDITELKQQQIKLKTSAMLDGSTGLYNKKTSEHMIRQRLGKQSEGQKYALFMIDIDDFKRFIRCLKSDTAILHNKNPSCGECRKGHHIKRVHRLAKLLF